MIKQQNDHIAKLDAEHELENEKFKKNYSYTFDYLQKTLKRISKTFAKQNKWCKRGLKC
jgi:hypothetical protein